MKINNKLTIYILRYNQHLQKRENHLQNQNMTPGIY